MSTFIHNHGGRLAAVVALVVLLLPVPAYAGDSPNGDAAVAWPGAFSEYTMADGSTISDVQDNNPSYSDIWAGAADNLPSTYFDSDGTNVFFRVRVRGNPDSRNGGFASTAYLISIAVDGTQAAVVGLNGKPSAVDFVYAGNADGSTIRQAYTTPFTNDGSGTSAGARWSAAPDEGYFVDYQIPISAITAVAPTVTPTTPIQMFFGSSQAANLSVINKDFMIGSDVSYVGLAVVTLSGAPVGSPPVAGADTATVGEDGSVLIDVAANDSDVDGDLDPTTAVVATPPASGSLVNNGDGTFTYSPDPGYTGPDAFTYSICDSGGLCDSAAVSVTVEPVGAPPVVNDDAGTVAEDGSVVIDATANDTDPDGDLDPATAVVATPPGNGTAVSNGDGTFTYTPDPDFNGTDSFTYTVCDSGGSCDSAAVDVTVDAVDDPPVAGADTATVLEDGSVLIDVAGNDSDVDGDLDPATAVVVTPPASGSLVNNGDGTFAYTPDPDFNGTDSFTYSICDGAGLCDSAGVDVTVDAVDDPPVAGADTATVGEDGSVLIDVAGNDSDVDGDLDPTTAVVATPPASGSLVNNGDGTFTYSPDPGYTGPDAFTYSICDSGGLCDSAAVSVTVEPVGAPPVVNDDAGTVAEDGSVVIDATANDTDPDGDLDPATAVVATPPGNGTAVSNGDGTFTYTPDPDFNGTDSFTYTVCDSGGSCDSAAVDVTVDAVDDPPVAGADTATVLEDGSVLIDVAGNDSDVDGDLDPATAVVVTPPASGSLVNNGDGTFAYTPDPDFNGTDSFTYSICDGAGLCDSAGVDVTVDAVDDPPVAGADTATVGEDGSVLIDVAANDSDVDGDLDPTTAVVATPPASGSLVNNGDGTFTYTPDPDFNGTDSFTYTVCDGAGLCDSAAVDVTVDAVNDPPIAAADTATVLEDGSVLIDAAANDTDVDGNLDITSATITALPGDGTATANGDGTFTYTPDPDFNGTDSFTYTVCDSGGLCDSATVSVTVDAVNDEPIATSDSVTLPEDSSVVVDVLANDSDADGDALAITAYDALSAAGGVVTCAAGSCTYAPPADYSGVDSFTYTVDDGNGGTATATVSLNVSGVNDPPGINDDPVSADEDTPLVIAVLANDTDPEGDTLSLDFFTQPPNGTVTDNGDGTLTYSPDADFSGTDSFGYRACDDGSPSLCEEASVTVTVDPINDPPVAGADSVATDEDIAVVFDVLANDFDQEADVLTVSAYDVVTTAGGTVSCTPAGSCTYSPPLLFSGSDSFTYTVDDGNGGLDTTSVSIEVGPVNNRPVAGDDAATVTEDTPATLSGISLKGNDSDPDVEVLTITAVTNGANGTATVVAGDIVYTPAADYNGPDTLTYTVCDPGGLCDTAEVVITVGPDNDSPVAKDDTATTDEDVPVTVDVLANDSDVDGDLLAVTLISTPPLNGTAVINGDNTITYTPAPDYFGSDEFQYEVSDGQGGTTTAWARFVTVNPVNDAPVAGVDAAAVDEDSSVIIDLIGGASDVDDVVLSVADLGLPANGTVVDNGDGTVTYTPAPDFAGADAFTYTVCDPGGLCATETVAVTVDSANDGPVVVDDSAVAAEDSSVTVDVLANDSDVDGDTLSVTGVSAPANGTAVVNPDGTVTYTPDADFFGTDSFTYTATDGTDTAVGTLNVTVAAVNDTPVATDDVVVIPEDSPATVDVLANDTDPDGDALSVTAVSAPTHGTVVVNPDGTLTYTPEPDFNGSDSFTYTATDGTVSVLGTVTVTATPVNDAPLVLDDPAEVAEDSSVTVDVVANDSDVEGDALVVTGVSEPANGTAVVNPDGTVTYTPDPDFSGADSFTYTITDGAESVSGTVSVTVNEVNDPPTAPGVLAVGSGLGEVPPPLPIADPEGGPLTVTLVDGNLPAGLTLNADGTWGGAATEQGTFVFTVDVCDAAGACTVMVLSTSIALLPATGMDAAMILRLAVVLVLLGWGALRKTNRLRPVAPTR